METVIAIDPGVSGGVAIRWHDGSVTSCPMPKVIEDLGGILYGIVPPYRVVLENVGGFVKGRGAPGSAMFSFGANWGFIRGFCIGAHIPVELVTPQRWMKDMGCGTKGERTDSQWKNALKGMAMRAHPQLKVTLQTADAILIMDWALRQWKPHKEVMPP